MNKESTPSSHVTQEDLVAGIVLYDYLMHGLSLLFNFMDTLRGLISEYWELREE